MFSTREPEQLIWYGAWGMGRTFQTFTVDIRIVTALNPTVLSTSAFTTLTCSCHASIKYSICSLSQFVFPDYYKS